MNENERAELYEALVRLCQNTGWTTDATYDHLHAAVDSIGNDDYEDDPHPDYPNMVWSNAHIEALVLAAIERSDTPVAVVVAIAEAQNTGYDSMDREMAFWIASKVKGWDYEDLYNAWLNAS